MMQELDDDCKSQIFNKYSKHPHMISEVRLIRF